MPAPSFSSQALGGRPLLDVLREHAQETTIDVRGAFKDSVPIGYRRDTRREFVRHMKSTVEQAQQTYRQQLIERATDARARYTRDYDDADDRRRFLDDVKFEVEMSRLADERGGPQVVRFGPGDNRPVDNPSAYELASKAGQALAEGDPRRARVLAQASVALGGPETAAVILDTAEREAFPEKLQAARDLEALADEEARSRVTFNEVVAQALGEAAKDAKAVGDDPSVYEKEQVLAATAAKIAAFSLVPRKPTGGVVSGVYREPNTGVRNGPKELTYADARATNPDRLIQTASGSTEQR